MRISHKIRYLIAYSVAVLTVNAVFGGEVCKHLMGNRPDGLIYVVKIPLLVVGSCLLAVYSMQTDKHHLFVFLILLCLAVLADTLIGLLLGL